MSRPKASDESYQVSATTAAKVYSYFITQYFSLYRGESYQADISIDLSKHHMPRI
ncbi:hypothetical protein RchiOBHm_Chr5g0070851 [Rosa chinensis]|uniref:Uncharacterized protein n=1 Tax=Rosa chinensis TaxID=74649 RepID=A0A2P6QKA7_ROSCH|nr:hypothetical protein RchiOBHm_Chr5g0070851 [Rosa chinensis]